MIIFANKIFILEILIIFFQGNIFSDIYITNLYLKCHIIVSLTTTGEKIKSLSLDKTIMSLINQTVIPYKILLSINKIDFAYISEFLVNLVKKRIIELIYIKEDLKTFNKYYYIPDEYKKYIIIALDDNIILNKNSIEKLFKSYKLYPNAISARRVYKMKFDENWILKPFYLWDRDFRREKNPKFSLFAIHGAGTLFPPNILNITDDFIFHFKKVVNVDDFVIKYFELKENLKTVYVNNTNKYLPLNNEIYEEYNRLLTVSPNEIQLKEDFGKKYNLTLYNGIIKEKVIILNETKEYFLNTINTNQITNNTLLVSMTSYPARIYGITEVFLSLLQQSAEISSYQCFLTLAKEEFINGEKDLPIDIQKLILNGWIKIIWHHNIYSHKKLIPIIQNYSDNDILIVDDDVLRTYNFIEIFQKEHKAYPSDIICGNFANYFDNKIELKRLTGYKGYKCGVFNVVPNIIFQTARPANGFGGVLYPKHTFSDKRFLNESLFMSLSPTSDELWQYAFIIIENKILRQTSIIIDNSVNFVDNTQKMKESLHQVNKDKYSIINNILINIFPDYQINTLERQKKIIVSLTSTKSRFKKLNLVLESIFSNKMKPSKIVLTLCRKDSNFLTKYLSEMIINKSIELIVTDNNLKSHNKYFEIMKKYRDYAIITIDDDIIYPNDLIETLYNSYIKNPNCIHAMFVHKITIENNKVSSYDKWLKYYTYELNPSFYLFPISEGGVLFPPNILNITDDNINEINKCLSSEDIYIKYLSRKRNIKIVWSPNKISENVEILKNNKSQRKKLSKRGKTSVILNEKYFNIFPII